MDNEWIRGALADELSIAGISSGLLATLDGAGSSHAAQRENGEQEDWEMHDGSIWKFLN
jgi:hypothetical protein